MRIEVLLKMDGSEARGPGFCRLFLRVSGTSSITSENGGLNRGRKGSRLEAHRKQIQFLVEAACYKLKRPFEAEGCFKFVQRLNSFYDVKFLKAVAARHFSVMQGLSFLYRNLCTINFTVLSTTFLST